MSDTPAFPTTKIMALGTLTSPPLTPDQQRTVMPKEVPGTLRLYLDGIIDQWFARQDGTGVVFLLNLTSVDEARTLLDGLPLGQAGLMTFEFVPLGPLFPLGLLLAK